MTKENNGDKGIDRISRIELEGLYQVKEEELPELFKMFTDAFKPYPKLDGAFPEPEKKQTAVEMVVEYYGRFDYRFGRLYSLDAGLHEGIAVLDSDEVIYTPEKFEAAGSMGAEFAGCSRRLREEDTGRWFGFFDEVDRQEAQLELPERYIYVDFLAVDPGFQGTGRGGKLIDTVCARAKEMGLPVMLFTNGQKDVEFYEKHGFRNIGVTKSREYGFENAYMLFEP